MEKEFKDGKLIDLDYTKEGWEIDDINVSYGLDNNFNYDFKTKLIEIDCVDKNSIKSDHIELRIKSDEFAWFVSSLIDDKDLSEKVRDYLEKREKTLPVELISELKAEKLND